MLPFFIVSSIEVKYPAMLMKYKGYRSKMKENKAIIKIGKHLLSRVRHVWKSEEEYERGLVAWGFFTSGPQK